MEEVVLGEYHVDVESSMGPLNMSLWYGKIPKENYFYLTTIARLIAKITRLPAKIIITQHLTNVILVFSFWKFIAN